MGADSSRIPGVKKLTVIIRIKDECHVLHTTICEALLPVDSQILKTLACSIKIVDRDT